MENDSPVSGPLEIPHDPHDFAAEEILARIKHDFRWPKPNDEAIASALQSIQRIAVHATGEEDGNGTHAGVGCSKCGELNTGSNRFCGYCGTLLPKTERRPMSSSNGGKHIYHHHYHYHVFENSPAGGNQDKASFSGEEGASSPVHAESAEQAVADVQKLVRDWTLFCNSRRIDQLAALYSSEAIVLRPDAAPVRGLAAIRQLIEKALNTGLGDVELDGSDTGVLGAIACLTGRSRMFVSAGAGKRQEQTGKYLIVARRESGVWKILADSWSLDSLREEPVAKLSPVTTKAQRKIS